MEILMEEQVMKKITVEMIQKYLGQEGKRYNSYVVFECPLCKAEGNDQNKHNLVFYENKGGYLKCMRKPKDNHSQKIYEAIIKKERGGNNELLQ